jgi:hypothetical protein
MDLQAIINEIVAAAVIGLLGIITGYVRTISRDINVLKEHTVEFSSRLKGAEKDIEVLQEDVKLILIKPRRG